MELLLWVGAVWCGCEDDVAFIDGDVFLSGGLDADLQISLLLARYHESQNCMS